MTLLAQKGLRLTTTTRKSLLLSAGLRVVVNGAPVIPPNRAATKVFKFGTNTGGSGLTYSQITWSEGAFTGGQLVFFNTLATAATIDGIIVAPTAVANDSINPVDGTGAAVSWTTVAGGPWTVPAAPTVGASGVPGVLKVPFTLNSIPRSDNATYPPLMMVRIHATTVLSAYAPAAVNGQQPAINATSVGTTATLNFTIPHRQNVGDTVVVAGFAPAAYSGTYVLTAVTSTSMSYTFAGGVGSSTVAGTMTPSAISSSITVAGTVATATLLASHGMIAGQTAAVSSAVPAALNGNFVVLSTPTPQSFTYTVANGTANATTQGALVLTEADVFGAEAGNIRPQLGFWKSGNFVTAPAGFTAPTKAFIAVGGVIFNTVNAGKIILGNGDSTYQGAGSRSHFYTWGHQWAAQVSTLASPQSYINCGIQGETTTQSFASAPVMANCFQPNGMVIPVWSINDAGINSSQSIADAAYSRSMAFGATLPGIGIKPIYTTAIPSVSISDDTTRNVINTRLRASGLNYVDFDSVVSNGASPARLITADDSGDGVHPSTSGNGVMATPCIPIFGAV